MLQKILFMSNTLVVEYCIPLYMVYSCLRKIFYTYFMLCHQFFYNQWIFKVLYYEPG